MMNLENGMFVGMGYEDIIVELEENEIEFETENGDFVTYILVGDFMIEFDENDVCNFSYRQDWN